MVVIFLEMAKTYLCETYSPKTEFSQRKLKIQETFLAASCAQTYVLNLEKPKPNFARQRRTETNKLVPTAIQIGLADFRERKERKYQQY